MGGHVWDAKNKRIAFDRAADVSPSRFLGRSSAAATIFDASKANSITPGANIAPLLSFIRRSLAKHVSHWKHARCLFLIQWGREGGIGGGGSQIGAVTPPMKTDASRVSAI